MKTIPVDSEPLIQPNVFAQSSGIWFVTNPSDGDSLEAVTEPSVTPSTEATTPPDAI